MRREVICPQCRYETILFDEAAVSCPHCDEITEEAPEGTVKAVGGSPIMVEPDSALAEKVEVEL